MSKSNDKKAKASKSKPKATESAYKQAQGKPTATPMPFGKKFSGRGCRSTRTRGGAKVRKVPTPRTLGFWRDLVAIPPGTELCSKANVSSIDVFPLFDGRGLCCKSTNRYCIALVRRCALREDIAHEPIPKRWVDLIRYLDEEERKGAERVKTQREPLDRQ